MRTPAPTPAPTPVPTPAPTPAPTPGPPPQPGAFASPWLARSYGRCAVVGSGHDLRCGERRGGSIDSSDAIFRSNFAQQAGRVSRPDLFHRPANDSVNRDPAIYTYLAHYLAKNSIEPSRAGTRTDFRTNCLFASHAVNTREVCVVSRHFWHMPWGRERFSNNRQTCCDRTRILSSYDASSLQAQARAGGFAFAFFAGASPPPLESPQQEQAHRGPATGHRLGARHAEASTTSWSSVPELEALVRSSGGNALASAIALCEQVELYGAGLHRGVSSTGADGAADLKYLHYYDQQPGKCHADGPFTVQDAREHYKDWTRVYGIFKTWRLDRLRGELMLHVLHALGVMRWVQ
jgi:hypothetical protein